MEDKEKMEFPARWEMLPDGKKRLVIKCNCKIEKNENGGQDVTVYAPALSVISEQLPIGG